LRAADWWGGCGVPPLMEIREPVLPPGATRSEPTTAEAAIATGELALSSVREVIASLPGLSPKASGTTMHLPRQRAGCWSVELNQTITRLRAAVGLDGARGHGRDGRARSQGRFGLVLRPAGARSAMSASPWRAPGGSRACGVIRLAPTVVRLLRSARADLRRHGDGELVRGSMRIRLGGGGIPVGGDRRNRVCCQRQRKHHRSSTPRSNSHRAHCAQVVVDRLDERRSEAGAWPKRRLRALGHDTSDYAKSLARSLVHRRAGRGDFPRRGYNKPELLSL